MSKTYCTACNDCITGDETRWAFDSPYCEDCFDNGYVYCQRCDALLARDDARINEDGEAYCAECYDEDFDPGSPNNPEMYDADRKQIMELSRDWLLGRRCRRAPIKVNERDHLLAGLRDQVGLVEAPVYVFGLKDREEYQVMASPDLMAPVEEFILLNGPGWKVAECDGCKRLGLALSIRQSAIKIAVKLVISLSEAKSPAKA